VAEKFLSGDYNDREKALCAIICTRRKGGIAYGFPLSKKVTKRIELLSRD
jgi:hypothetical protein